MSDLQGMLIVQELAGLIKATPDAALKDFAVVDVRGDDFVVSDSSPMVLRSAPI